MRCPNCLFDIKNTSVFTNIFNDRNPFPLGEYPNCGDKLLLLKKSQAFDYKYNCCLGKGSLLTVDKTMKLCMLTELYWKYTDSIDRYLCRCALSRMIKFKSEEETKCLLPFIKLFVKRKFLLLFARKDINSVFYQFPIDLIKVIFDMLDF